MTCIHHDSVIQSIFTALKVLCALLIYPSLHLQPLATTPFTVSIVLPLPERLIGGILLYAAFSDWFLSLSNIHLKFLHGLPWWRSG